MVAMAVTVAAAVTTATVAMAAVVAAMVGSGVSGGGGVSVGGNCVMVMPVASHPFAAPMAHLEMESCPNTQGASFTHA